LNDIYLAIVARGGVCTEGDYSTYDDGVRSITCDDTVLELKGYLTDISNAILIRAGVFDPNDYSTYDTGILSINTSSSIAQLQNQVAQLEAKVTQYESDFADIATAIKNKGGTVTSASAYSDFDTYIASIPNTVVQGGKLDSIKSQIAGIGAKTQNARSINKNFGDVPLIRVTDGSELFANMPSFDDVDMYLDMSACTDCTDMFKNSPNVPVITILNFGNKSNADLVLDLALRDDFDLSYMAGDIIKYTTSPDGTKHVRKFLVTQGAYDLNNDWGAIETLRNKGITVEVKSGT